MAAEASLLHRWGAAVVAVVGRYALSPLVLVLRALAGGAGAAGAGGVLRVRKKVYEC
jgi:hypothetical protein